MRFSQWQNMDVQLLVGLVNTELRNHSESLEDFLKTHDIDEEELISKLAGAGYHYQDEIMQFRARSA